MDLNTAHANYDDALAHYTAALARVESGENAPGLDEEVQRLYDQTLAAHAVLTEAASAPAPLADAAEEPLTSSFDLSEEAVSVPAPVIGSAPLISTPPEVAPAAPHGVVEQPPVLGRRQTLSRFSPPAADASPEQPLRRDVLSSLRTETRSEIGKERKVAGNLPEWNPLPPGEILTVTRR